MNFDTIITDTLVFDGSGAPPFAADIAIKDGRIAQVAPIGTIPEASAPWVIDAKGRATAPGFIDFHSHSEWILPSPLHRDILLPFLRQGITTVVGGNCGFSPFPVNAGSREAVLANSKFLTNEEFGFEWESAGEFFDLLETRGTLLNAASLVGHGSLRAFVAGNRPDPLGARRTTDLLRTAERALAEGALGISFGLAYVPGIFADEGELESLFGLAAKHDALVTIHGHTYSWTSPFFEGGDGLPHNVRDVRSLVDLALRTGARLNLSHVLLKGRETWGTLDRVLEEIDRGIARGGDISFGVIPYHWGNTLINTLLPKWFLEDFSGNMGRPDAVRALKKELEETERSIGRFPSDIFLLWGNAESLKPHEGRSLEEIAAARGMDPIDAALFLMRESGGKAKILTASYSGKEGSEEGPLDALLAHDRSICEIDTIVTSVAGPHNPATYGACAKLLGRYARLRGVMPMEKAVRKLTGLPADRARLPGIGYIRPGYRADIVLFDQDGILDRNTIADPDLPPEGVMGVMIGGKTVLQDGRLTEGALHGSVFRK